jgi:hypothetical protein
MPDVGRRNIVANLIHIHTIGGSAFISAGQVWNDYIAEYHSSWFIVVHR